MEGYDVDQMLELALTRLTVLADINSALAETMDASEGLRRVCTILARRVGDWCAIDRLAGDDEVHRICATRTETASALLTEERTTLPETATGPLARVLRGAGPLLLTRADLQKSAPHRDPWDTAEELGYARRDAVSAIIAPLWARREVLGALTVTRCGDHPLLVADDVRLVDDIVHRVGLAIDNARLHRETQHIAERLQRSLLPPLPHGGALTMAARYSPSASGAQVGGDWYDSFLLPNGDTTLIIGDVTGHDLQAAVTMSKLRNMLRGIACDRQESPHRILQRLDVAQHTLYPDATATCLYALVHGPENGPWELEHSSAGHPAPLLVTKDGDTRYLDDGHGHMLGASTDLPRTSATAPLPAQSTVLLYTDGLIERRGESIDRGFTRLRQHAAALARETPETFCAELLTGLASDNTDDIALLALRLPPDDHSPTTTESDHS